MNILLDLKEISLDAWQVFCKTLWIMGLSIIGFGVIEGFLYIKISKSLGVTNVSYAEGPAILFIGMLLFLIVFTLVGRVQKLFYLSIYSFFCFLAFSFLIFLFSFGYFTLFSRLYYIVQPGEIIPGPIYKHTFILGVIIFLILGTIILSLFSKKETIELVN